MRARFRRATYSTSILHRMRGWRRGCCQSRSARRQRTRRPRAAAARRASRGLPVRAADRVEDLARGGAAFGERIAAAVVGAVPLVFKTLRELDEPRAPGVLRADPGDVLPIRAALAVVNDVRGVERDEHGVIPGADRFAKTAGGGELRGVAFPFVRAARKRIVVARRGQRHTLLDDARGRLAAAADHL